MVVFCTQTPLSSRLLCCSFLSYSSCRLLLNYLLESFLFPAVLVSPLASPLCFLSFFLLILFSPPAPLSSPLSHQPPSFPIFAPVIYILHCFRRGDTTWLQLTPYRARGFPIAHSQPAAFAVVESISTMLLLSRPLPLCITVFAPAFFFFFALHLCLLLPLSLSVSMWLPVSLCFSLPMSLWASPGLVAVGSTRASHTVT